MSRKQILEIAAGTALALLLTAIVAGWYYLRELDTRLMKASARGDLEAVQLLLRKGAQVGYQDNVGFTPLFIATQGQRTDVVRLLLQQGADPNAATVDGWTPLMNAAANGGDEIARGLLRNGADVNARNQSGETALMLARQTYHASTERLLRQASAR